MSVRLGASFEHYTLGNGLMSYQLVCTGAGWCASCMVGLRPVSFYIDVLLLDVTMLRNLCR